MTANTTPASAIRVLHVVGQMGYGGVETWLMHLLRHTDRSAIQMDFLVHSSEPAPHDEEIHDLGSRIISCPHPHRLHAYVPRLLGILRSRPRYQVVHSHVYTFSGLVLAAGRAADVPVRIAHSHNDIRAAPAWTARRGYVSATRLLIGRCATHKLAVTETAAAALFGSEWSKDPAVRILPYGFNFDQLRTLPSRDAHRRSLRLPSEGVIVGHVGSFTRQKNHTRLVDVFRGLVEAGTNAHLLLVGDGPLREGVLQYLAEAGLEGRFTFAGLQPDVGPYLAAMDVLLFPSLYEGFGIVVLEAQATGTPVLASRSVPPEAVVFPDRVYRIDLERSDAEWVSVLLDLLEIDAVEPHVAAAKVSQSRYGIAHSALTLQRIYNQAIGRES